MWRLSCRRESLPTGSVVTDVTFSVVTSHSATSNWQQAENTQASCLCDCVTVWLGCLKQSIRRRFRWSISKFRCPRGWQNTLSYQAHVITFSEPVTCFDVFVSLSQCSLLWRKILLWCHHQCMCFAYKDLYIRFCMWHFRFWWSWLWRLVCTWIWSHASSVR